MEYIVNCGYVEKKFKGSWSGMYGCGYYAYIKDGLLTIGEERGRDGGTLYTGEYKGENTPWLKDIQKENEELYNDIVAYFS